jgi:hypothetical protein
MPVDNRESPLSRLGPPGANGSPQVEAEHGYVYDNTLSNSGGPATQLPPAAPTQFTPTGATGEETTARQYGVLI